MKRISIALQNFIDLVHTFDFYFILLHQLQQAATTKKNYSLSLSLSLCRPKCFFSVFLFFFLYICTIYICICRRDDGCFFFIIHWQTIYFCRIFNWIRSSQGKWNHTTTECVLWITSIITRKSKKNRQIVLPLTRSITFFSFVHSVCTSFFLFLPVLSLYTVLSRAVTQNRNSIFSVASWLLML